MATTQELSLIPGWYGKMPCLGDFASRRLTSEFIEPWDTWLQRSMAASRSVLGERWLDMFLTSPMWRFVLTPGTCGDDAWAGLLFPSVDRVGRYFPMTFALPLPATQADLSELVGAHRWYEGLEGAALSALSMDFSPDDLEAALAANRYPTSAPDDAGAIATIGEWWRRPAAQPQSVGLTSFSTLPALIGATTRSAFADGGIGRSLWWSVASESEATELHCAIGLPPDEYFVVFMNGFLERGDDSDIDAQPLEIPQRS